MTKLIAYLLHWRALAINQHSKWALAQASPGVQFNDLSRSELEIPLFIHCVHPLFPLEGVMTNALPCAPPIARGVIGNHQHS
jgi:hypothetical protein